MAITQEMATTVINSYELGVRAAIDLRNNWSSRIVEPVNPDSVVGVGIVTLGDNCADDHAPGGFPFTEFEKKCFSAGFYQAFKSRTTEYAPAAKRMTDTIDHIKSWVDRGQN
jgi:hypothetical protein